jgi:phage-related baseplate assembly protein
MTSVNLAALPAISFAPLSAAETEAAVITTYETVTGVTLQPGDPVRLFLETLAYLVSVQNGLIDLAGKQNLLAYARGPHLDHLGALMGVVRIPAQAARCIVRFSIAEPLDFEVPIPAGTRVTTQSGTAPFATAAQTSVPPGALFTEAVAVALHSGSEANGLLSGQISRLVDPLPYITAVANVSVSLSGSGVENDERLRERIRIAPESYTNAGSEGAYLARTLEVSQEIEAVTISSPAPGVVDVRFVLAGGELPDAATIDMVREHLSGETVRPLTDTVLVDAPEPVEYAVRGYWYLRRSQAALLSAVNRAVEKAVETYRVWQRSHPGRDINPTRLESLVEQAGAKRLALESPEFITLTPVQVARETEVTLLFGGLEDD